MSINNYLHLLDEMAVFVRVVETGSFSETAKEIGTTPSAVSRKISRLEKALSARLLHRTTRKLRLSESGEAMFNHCQNMVTAAKSAMSISDLHKDEPEGIIRVSVPKAVGRFVLHPHMAEFLARYPKIDLQVVLEDKYVDLIEDRVDLVIRITDRPSPGLMGKELMKIDHIICASPQYLQKHGMPTHPRDLANHSCIYLGETPADTRWKFKRGTESVQVDIHGRYAANHTVVRLDAALNHIGIASLPYFTARTALQQGKCIQVLPEWDFISSYYGSAWLLYSPTRYLPLKLKVFIDYLVERMRQEPELKARKQN
ncbi:LysR family transcriptional regulator [Budvicia aquatica]|uniref:D-malate degradation protein R n=1 Tax=Budvicia aquatica TaxID=82979 RepID=A0A2C6DJ95_9GAMM|nr:LysR family transcriptional regulator [Budvicia aquatica]PHI28515.1 LysR family transcriptional regulator [Budvicia aquatica]VFS46459.1 D-malate degradation protein R [Budvicia aquatica]